MSPMSADARDRERQVCVMLGSLAPSREEEQGQALHEQTKRANEKRSDQSGLMLIAAITSKL